MTQIQCKRCGKTFTDEMMLADAFAHFKTHQPPRVRCVEWTPEQIDLSVRRAAYAKHLEYRDGIPQCEAFHRARAEVMG